MAWVQRLRELAEQLPERDVRGIADKRFAQQVFEGNLWLGREPVSDRQYRNDAVFMWQGIFELTMPNRPPQVFLSGFRAAPVAQPLATPSGRIEIVSATLQGFGYDDCPGYPAWRAPPDWQSDWLPQVA